MNAIYARANDDEVLEIRAQIARCKEQARLQGMQIDADKIYTDAGGWEMDANRLGLGELVNDVHVGIIDRIYVDALDRFGRDVDIAPIIAGWVGKGVTIVDVSAEARNTRAANFGPRAKKSPVH